MKVPDGVTMARIRMTQRLLIGAVESNPEYITDDNWQAAMESVSRMLRNAGQEIVEDAQLVLFPGAGEGLAEVAPKRRAARG